MKIVQLCQEKIESLITTQPVSLRVFGLEYTQPNYFLIWLKKPVKPRFRIYVFPVLIYHWLRKLLHCDRLKQAKI